MFGVTGCFSFDLTHQKEPTRRFRLLKEILLLVVIMCYGHILTKCSNTTHHIKRMKSQL